MIGLSVPLNLIEEESSLKSKQDGKRRVSFGSTGEKN